MENAKMWLYGRMLRMSWIDIQGCHLNNLAYTARLLLGVAFAPMLAALLLV